MVSVIELLLETLEDLSDEDLKRFRELLWYHQPYFFMQWMRLETTDLQDTVFLTLQFYGQESVLKTKEALEKMKRMDLVEKLSDSSSGFKKKLSVDEWRSALIQKVAAVPAVKHLLLETLNDLSFQELKKFRMFLQSISSQKNLPDISWRLSPSSDRTKIVDLMVEQFGQQCVEVTREVVRCMYRTDLIQKPSEIISGQKEKHSVDEAAAASREAAVASVRQILWKTLKHFSPKEFNEFRLLLQFTSFQRNLPGIPQYQLLYTDTTYELIDLMEDMWGEQSVEVTREVLKDMNRTDLVQKLSEINSEPQEEVCPPLVQRVETMASVIELLLETLEDLSDEERKEFRKLLWYHNRHLYVRWKWMKTTDLQDTVFEIVQTFGQDSVLKTKEALKKMERMDLVEKLSDSSSGFKKKLSVDERRSALIQKVAAVAAVKHLLLETLNYLSFQELKKFRRFLQSISSQKNIQKISWMLSSSSDRTGIVDLMMEQFGQQSVEVTREVFRRMNRTDLIQKLPDTSSGQKEKHSVDEPAAESREAAVASVRRILQETLKHFSPKELNTFKFLLQFTSFQKNLPGIPQYRLFEANTIYELIDLMEEVWGEQSVEVTRKVLKDMNRTDLVQKLSEISSESKGASRNLELEGCGSVVQQDSSVWTKLEPEVNNADTDEAPTYSLQSEVGHFECSVSGLRWVCEEKARFKYQFCSWGGHMERMESRQYMPAGALIDISVIAGKLNEVYLPHWICIKDNPKILDKFAVLHIDECGDVVEKASEVTASHVKLTEPIFSPRGVLVKLGFRVKIKCNVLMFYKPNTRFLKLHVFVIPLDPALQQTVDKKESSNGYEGITKPRPDKHLKMQQGFSLTADIDTATIHPEKITLRYDNQDPNFYEVYIKNPDREFNMRLHPYSKKNEAVWSCEIRKDDHPSSGPIEAAGSFSGSTGVRAVADEKHSVDEQLSAQLHKAATISSDRERILKMLQHLKESELKEFKWTLEDSNFMFMLDLPNIPRCKLDKADMLDLVDLMIQAYSQRSVEVTKKVFKKMNRNDLVLMLSDSSS